MAASTIAILTYVALALTALAAVLAWGVRHGRAYTARMEAQFPPSGRFIEAEGVKLHVGERGETGAPRLFLIHGAATAMPDLILPIEAISAGAHHIAAYDRPGLGYSERPARAHELKVQAACAAAALEQTGDGGPALVIGHSLGAAVALRLAHERPDLVRGLLLLAPASHPFPGKTVWWSRVAANPLFGPLFCAALIPLFGPPSLPGALKRVFFPAKPPPDYAERIGLKLIFRPRPFRASALDVAATKREFARQMQFYAELLTPAIIITSDVDKVVSPRIHARALAFDMGAELVTAPGAGHAPHATRPDLIEAAIARLEAMAASASED